LLKNYTEHVKIIKWWHTDYYNHYKTVKSIHPVAHSWGSPRLPWYWARCQLWNFFRLTWKLADYQWVILLQYLNKCLLVSNTLLMTSLSLAGPRWQAVAPPGGKGEASPLWVDVQKLCNMCVLSLSWNFFVSHDKYIARPSSKEPRSYTYNRYWGTSYSRPLIDPYLTSPGPPCYKILAAPLVAGQTALWHIMCAAQSN